MAYSGTVKKKASFPFLTFWRSKELEEEKRSPFAGYLIIDLPSNADDDDISKQAPNVQKLMEDIFKNFASGEVPPYGGEITAWRTGSGPKDAPPVLLREDEEFQVWMEGRLKMLIHAQLKPDGSLVFYHNILLARLNS